MDKRDSKSHRETTELEGGNKILQPRTMVSGRGRDDEILPNIKRGVEKKWPPKQRGD